MKVILANKTAEIVEKKSRFISNIFYVANENEAIEELNKIKKIHYDAKHNCFAYIVGENAEIIKSSDDGEPSGTAGHPMLDILKGIEITNIIAIVTRYFGGILLGTGGLVRAYSDSLKIALQTTEFADIKEAYVENFSLDYDEYGLFTKMINVAPTINADAIEINKTFTEKINMEMLVFTDKAEHIKKTISNITKGRVILNLSVKKCFFLNGKQINWVCLEK